LVTPEELAQIRAIIEASAALVAKNVRGYSMPSPSCQALEGILKVTAWDVTEAIHKILDPGYSKAPYIPAVLPDVQPGTIDPRAVQAATKTQQGQDEIARKRKEYGMD